MAFSLSHFSLHAALAVSGKMSDVPVDNLFKKFQNSWETIKLDINLNNLNRFKWSKRKGTFLEEKVEICIFLFSKML